MPITWIWDPPAENVAAKCNITREEMDAFAVESHKKAAAAQDAGHLAASIIPLDGIDPEGNPIVFDQDQGIRRGTTMESLASLQPCFKKDGRCDSRYVLADK